MKRLMARKKLSEYKSKIIVNSALDIPYVGWEVFGGDLLDYLDDHSKYVLKVDQAVKGRFKKGLVFLDVSKKAIKEKIKVTQRLGYEFFIVEPYFVHRASEEKYISLKREREGIALSYSAKGGIDVESKPNFIKTTLFNIAGLSQVADVTGFSVEQLKALKNIFDESHMSLLEINPYITTKSELHILDAAIEVDDTGELLVSNWTRKDLRSPLKNKSTEEDIVQKMNRESPASFSLETINPNGAIFLLLSGGGASVVVADEIYSHGYESLLANYGEYSGNPTEDETALYTKQVIKLLLNSNASKKVLFIGGAVANFTNIAATFNGVIRVLYEEKEKLSRQEVKIFVRRGGPNQEIGLKMIQGVLEDLNLMGGVYDPSVSIPEAVQFMLEEFSK